MATSPSNDNTASYPKNVDTMNIIRPILMPTRQSFIKIKSVDKDVNLIRHEKLKYLDKTRYDSMLHSIVQIW
jgi:hypothetical protein